MNYKGINPTQIFTIKQINVTLEKKEGDIDGRSIKIPEN